MPKYRPPITTFHDAIAYAAWFGRFSTGEFGKRMGELAAFMVRQEEDLAATRERAARLAAALEKAETKGCRGEGTK